MKRLLPLLFLFTAFISNAQNTLDNIGLTNATPASVAYSLRQLSTSYTGPLVRVKVGASFYDVYPDASTKKFSLSSKISASISTYNAAVAVASANALSTIISGSTDATVAIWYDQSGNGVHVLSSSATAKIITAGSILTMSGQPTIYFYGSNSFLTSSTTVNYSSQTNATVNAAAQDVASTNYISGIISTGDNGGWGLCYDPTSTIKGYWVDASGGNGAFSNEHSTEPKIITGTIGTPASSTSSAIYINNILKGTKTPQNIANGTTDKIYVGTRGNFAGRQFIGNISETMMFPKTLSAAEQAALESSQSQFLPPSVTVTGDACVNKTTLTTASGLTAYAWYKDNVVISGATSNVYTPTSIGAYKVEVTNGSYSSTSITTTIYECGRTADGRMIIVEGSTTLVSRDGSINNGKGVTESGKIVTKPWSYGTVTTATGRIWLDRNLGASRVALSSTDVEAYGDYYQWGRPADGHQTKYLTNNNSSGFTNTKSSSSVPSTDLWIVPTDASNDWLITPDNSLWTGANPATNPCPAGFRIPTEAEWSAENIANVTATFQTNGLKLTLPGMLTNFGSGGASYTTKGSYGQYLTQTAYTSSPVVGGARYFGVNASNQAWFDQNYYKSHGMSVRCIKN
jgi:uncharacterized protein (TIGR02145 family)